MHPAKEGFAALPFFDEFDLSTVDILLLSQYVFLHLPATRPMFFRIFLSFFL
jgi:cleavage and polyadenylation specificity factor subunit 3